MEVLVIRRPRTPHAERLLAILGVLASAGLLGGLAGLALGFSEEPAGGRLPLQPGAPRSVAPAVTAARTAPVAAALAAAPAPAAAAPGGAPAQALPTLGGDVVDLAPGSRATWVEAHDPDGVSARVRVEAGRFRLVLPGRAPWRVRAARDGASSAWVYVESPREGLRLELRALAPLRGWVTGPQGPLAGARVWVDVDGGLSVEAESGPDGSFALELVADAAIRVRATYPELAPASVRLAAHERAEVPSLELSLQPLIPVLAGQFLDAQGQPLRGPLLLDPLAPDRHEHAVERDPLEVELDPEGRPAIEGLPDGVWIVSLPEPAADELRAWVCEVEAQDAPVNLALPATPRGRLSGRVAAPEDASVEVELRPHPTTRERFGFLATRFARPDGGFDFPSVPEGTYRVQASWGDAVSRPALVEVGPAGSAWVVLEE